MLNAPGNITIANTNPYITFSKSGQSSNPQLYSSGGTIHAHAGDFQADSNLKVAANLTVNGNATISGNLTVNGTISGPGWSIDTNGVLNIKKIKLGSKFYMTGVGDPNGTNDNTLRIFKSDNSSDLADFAVRTVWRAERPDNTYL
jgi:hypothetical protein